MTEDTPIENNLEEAAPIEITEGKDEASGAPSSVSFAPILELDREFSFQHKFESQKNEDIEISDDKKEELKNFLALDEGSLVKSYQKFCYSQNQGSEYSHRMNE